MFGKLLEFDRMHEKQNIFCFLKGEINLKVEIFLDFQFFLRNVSEKTEYFNTGFVSYNVNIQLDIMQI